MLPKSKIVAGVKVEVSVEWTRRDHEMHKWRMNLLHGEVFWGLVDKIVTGRQNWATTPRDGQKVYNLKGMFQ